MSERARHFYEFGPYRIDAAEQQLWRDGEEIALTPKAFGVLLLLVSNHGRVISKEDFMREVWPDSFVEESNLADNISILRQALGDDAREPRYIKTVPRRGYRFVGEVTEGSDEPLGLVVAERTRAHIIIEEQDHSEDDMPVAGGVAGAGNTSLIAAQKMIAQRWWNLRRGAVAIACLVAGVFAAAFYLSRAARGVPPADNMAPIRSIAVLPFKPLVAAERDESLEMGMADTLIAKLSRISQLTVRPTSAVRQYTKLEDEAVSAGRELQVDSVLDGSVQQSGERIRVTVRLVRVSQGETLWTEQFDEKLTDIFSVQDSISHRVASALSLQLNGAEDSRLTKHETDNPEAYQAYLKGRFFWNKRTSAGLKSGIQYFQQAIALDPNYARAHAGLADCYNVYYFYDSSALPQESFPRARDAALKALELDHTLAEAHASLAYERMRGEFDWAGAEAEFRRALELNPNYATAHQWYGEYLMLMGRMDESLREMRRAQELDPTSLIISQMLDAVLLTAGRTEEAFAQTQKTLELNPDFGIAHMDLGFIYLQRGMKPEALAAHRKAAALVEGDTFLLSVLGYTAAVAGERGEAQRVLSQLRELARRRYVPPSHFAIVYAGLGDRNQALTWLEKAHAEHDEFAVFVKIFPTWQGLRSEPRYVSLLQSMNFPP